MLSIWNVFLDSHLLQAELVTIPNDDKLFFSDQLVLLKVLFEVKIEFVFDFLHGVKRILYSRDLLRFMGALFVFRMFMIVYVLAKIDIEREFDNIERLFLLKCKFALVIQSNWNHLFLGVSKVFFYVLKLQLVLDRLIFINFLDLFRFTARFQQKFS